MATAESTSPQADAGKQFVLESKGTWIHACYHLTSATAGPPLLALPFAMASLGWAPGVLALIVAAAISFYGCYLLFLATEELEERGLRCFRFWDVAFHVTGPTLAHYVVAPLQYLVLYILLIFLILLGGGTLEAIIKTAISSSGHVKLYEYTVIFGALSLIIAQVPSFHSLRFFNLFSMLLCLGFSICAVVGSIISGVAPQAPPKDYSVQGSHIHIMFGAFNAISIMMTAYANPIIVEIQATLAPPTTGKMLKALLVCYSMALLTFFSVAITGYWAFGNSSQGVIFNNMQPFVPKWLYILANALVCLQLIPSTALCLQPIFAKYEGMVVDVKAGQFSPRNVLLRLVGRSALVSVATLFAAMLPFFADFSALMGAFGFMPLCIILPLVYYTLVFANKRKGFRLITLLNMLIIVLASLVTIIGTVAAVRQIVLDVNTYRLFPSM